MDCLIVVNGKILKENATLKDVKYIVKRLNLKLVRSYTFEMRLHMRRVLKFEAQGTIYSVYGPKRYIDFNAYTQDIVYFGFDKDKAYSYNYEVSEFKAKEIDFNLPYLQEKFFSF